MPEQRKIPPAMSAMNVLGDSYKADLENRDKSLPSFGNAYKGWSDFCLWLETDIKRSAPDGKADLMYSRTLPEFKVFQAWFYWQRNRMLRIEAVDKLEGNLAKQRRMTDRGPAEIVRELYRD